MWLVLVHTFKEEEANYMYTYINTICVVKFCVVQIHTYKGKRRNMVIYTYIIMCGGIVVSPRVQEARKEKNNRKENKDKK